MGTWGVESFANDAAMDWVAELERDGMAAIEGALRKVIASAPAYLESAVCAEGLAAAEVVAALRGQSAFNLPQDVLAWTSQPRAPINPQLSAVARQAVLAIGTESELRALWEDTEEAHQWLDTIVDLQTRLA